MGSHSFSGVHYQKMKDDKEDCSVSDSIDESNFSSSDCGKQTTRSHVEYCCEYCNIKFRKHAKYIRHLRTHTKEVGIDFVI